jgi:hypothetical protein
MMNQEITLKDGDLAVPFSITIDENGIGITVAGPDPEKPLADVFVEIANNKVNAYVNGRNISPSGWACSLVTDLHQALEAVPI